MDGNTFVDTNGTYLMSLLTSFPRGSDTPKAKPDVAVIVCLLKAVGFQLEKFEKEDSCDVEEIREKSIRLTLQCGTSKMQAVLNMDDIDCQCPEAEEQNGSFWSVTGTDHVNKKIEETGSTLLPPVSKDKNLILQRICHSMFDIIEDKQIDVADMSTSSVCLGMTQTYQKGEHRNMIRSSTQPEIKITGRPSLPANYKPSDMLTTSNMLRPITPCSSSSDSSSSNPKSLVHQDTYSIIEEDDIEEQKVSVPEISKTSEVETISNKTPEVEIISNLCGSLDRLPLPEADNNILEYVLTSLESIQKVVKSHLTRPITSSRSSLIDDEVFQKATEVFGRDASSALKCNISPLGSTNSLQNLSRSSTTLQKSNVQSRRSIGGVTRTTLASEKNASAFKTPIQTRKPLVSQAKVNSARSSILDKTKTTTEKAKNIAEKAKNSAEKAKKIVPPVSERANFATKKRVSEIGVAGSTRTGVSPNTRTQARAATVKPQVSSTSRYGYKK